jgi:hypothetical protein
MSLKNLRNPQNTTAITVNVNQTIFSLRYRNMAPSKKLTLQPPVLWPVSAEPSEIWFTVERRKLGLEEYGKFVVFIEPEPYLEVSAEVSKE